MRADGVPLTRRFVLVADSLALLLPATIGVCGAVALLERVTRERGRAAKVASSTFRLVLVGTMVLLYATSWTEFWHVSAFLDRAAFLFWLPNPVQVFHWVYPPLAIGVLTAVGVVTLALTWWVPRRISRMSAGAQRGLVAAGAAVAGACLATSAVGALTVSRSAEPQGLPYTFTRDNHTGPMLHVLADLSGLWRPVPPPTAVRERVAESTIRRPIISMDEYLTRVDRTRVKPWNVVMIQIESLRSDQLRAYGGSRDVMPTVDRVAGDSRVFTNAYVQASHSNYADLVPLASQYPLRSAEIHTYPENPSYPRVLIYDLLKALGYKTAIFSSQNENWGGMINFHRRESLDRFFHAANFDGPTYAPWEDISFANWVKQTSEAGSVDDRYTVDAAIKWIEDVSKAPFFLHMNLQSSHVPYVVPNGFRRPFGPATLDFTIMWGRFPRDKVQIVKDRYADSLYYEDAQIARLLDALRRQGVWDNTVVVIGGDNGEAFYEHGFASHATALFNEVMKVPMIIRVPGAAPERDDRPAMFLDIPPTILEALGLPPHPGFQGTSLLDPMPKPVRSLFMIAQTPVVYETAIVRAGFKLLWAERSGNRYLGWNLLYDLTNDPGEQTDVASSHPELVADLSTRLQAWRSEQLAYYTDLERQAREYPPVLVD